jgi:hypothetical protein
MPPSDLELRFSNFAVLAPISWSGLSAAQPVNVIVVIIIGLNGKFLRFRRDGVNISYQEVFTRPELKSL